MKTTHTYLSTETMQIDQDYWKKIIETLTIGKKNPDIIIERVSNFDVLTSFDEILFRFHGGQNDPPKMF